MMYNIFDSSYGHMGFFGFGGFFMILFWGLIIWGIAYLMRRSGGCGHSDHKETEDRSMAILNERYAKGEISKEEYESKKKDITKIN